MRADEVDLALTSAPPADPQLAVHAAARPTAWWRCCRRRIRWRRRHECGSPTCCGSPLVLMDRDSSVRRSVDAACASIGRFAEPAYEVAFMSTAIGLVRAGLGATLLPSSAAELRAAGDLVIRDLESPRIERQLGILKQRRRAYSPAAEALVAALREAAEPRHHA